MGANEKYEAAMHGYVPDVQIVRRAYAQAGKSFSNEEARADTFDRWLTQIRAEAKQEALEELAAKTHSKFQAAWIRGQAREYTQGPRKIVGAFATPETNKENKK